MKSELIENEEVHFEYQRSLKIAPVKKTNPLKWMDLYVNRPLAALIVKIVFNTRITPNGLTYFSFFLGVLAVILFCLGEYKYFVAGAILTQISSIVDGADGMLARARNQTSTFGAHLDLFFDRILDFSLFMGIAVGTYIYTDNFFLLALGTLGAGLYMLQVNMFYLIKRYLKTSDTGGAGELRAFMLWTIFFFAVADRFDLFIYTGFLVGVIIIIARTIYFIRLGYRREAELGFGGLEHTQQTQPGQQQGDEPADQHQS